MRIAYIRKGFHDSTLQVISWANEIIAQYQAQGLDLTLRQLYYQMVARDLIPNEQKEYKRLGSIVADGRLAGLISWRAIEDRTRNLQGNTHWESPAQIIRGAVNGYRIDKWADQPHRVEVWIEKDALVGVIAPVCRRLDVDYFSCRGYTSLSEMWQAGQRLARYIARDQAPIILHLGDHDPSGIDMTRDIEDRLEMFAGSPITVKRIALNRDQVEQYGPPPNPAKITDSRAGAYIAEHGRQSWELDALEPTALQQLIEDHVADWRDEALYQQALEREGDHKDMLRQAAEKMQL